MGRFCSHERGKEMRRHARIALTTMLALIVISVLVPVSHAAAGGMVANGDFEQGEDEVPYGWLVTGNAVRVRTGPVYQGQWAALIDEEGAILTQWVENIEAVLEYEIWGWIYVSGNITGVITVDFWEGKEGRQLSSTRMLPTSETHGSYVQKVDKVGAPPGATHLRIRLLGTGWSEGAEVRFDEIGVWPPGGGFWDRLRDWCFIATAAYGTRTASQLNVLRDFRDQVLLRNAVGALLVETYYRVSPSIAGFIARSAFMRGVVRTMLLDPTVHFLRWSRSLWAP